MEEEIKNFLKEKGILSADKNELFIAQKDGTEVVINNLIKEFHEQKVGQSNEELGKAIDSLENCTFGLVNMTTLPDNIHVEGLRGSLPNIVLRLKAGFVKITGENPWE